ncbi:FAD binding domain-containing protein [Aspergillus caelatus]|uniref:FAD binding domain-containing protein n=1 Tax=Aspergillus caelatus TaxID=61420 RepID=A0A5N6ZNY5_9EURO|nr:FAD binding domain-containing protein [Aspergillus caelatus]KAE8359332.1 FAD binding domain-containing protein [Aspergillus caelatus]
MENKYDIVIVGAGPVGLMLSACLLRLGPYKIKHIDDRAEPTNVGRADGVQARTLDVLEDLGLKDKIMSHKPALLSEVAFWNASKTGQGICRTGKSTGYPAFIRTRHPFTTILHQGKLERIFLDDLKDGNVEVQRPWTIEAVRIDMSNSEYPVETEVATVDGCQRTTVRSKYVFGADGARSRVRELLGIPMVYKDPTIHIWGVIDGVIESDFPDIQIKCTIRSDAGSAMIIPQTGDRVRVYVQLSPRPEQDLPTLASQSEIQETARSILSPYCIRWKCVDWHSMYRIGQGVATTYAVKQHIFIGGDACHTHSPKAGQGMNYGFLDAHNLAWKLHLTYEDERKQAASRLIEFDATYAGLFSSQQVSNEVAHRTEFMRVFKQNCLLTSGYGVSYPPNSLICPPAKQDRATSISVSCIPGQIFPLATVTRVHDARVVNLEQEISFNGSFRIYVFAGKPSATRQVINELAENQASKASQLLQNIGHAYVRESNSYSPFFAYFFIFNACRSLLAPETCLPSYFLPYQHHLYADEQPTMEIAGAAHLGMGIDPTEGGLVVVRPDGYIGCVSPLTAGFGAVAALNQHFERIHGHISNA